MNVKFNSSIGFGAKKMPCKTVTYQARKALTVMDPFQASNVMDGFKHNISVVEGLPRDVLNEATRKAFKSGLRAKPNEFKYISEPMKEIWNNLVCDTTKLGTKARKVLNEIVINKKK